MYQKILKRPRYYLAIAASSLGVVVSACTLYQVFHNKEVKDTIGWEMKIAKNDWIILFSLKPIFPQQLTPPTSAVPPLSLPATPPVAVSEELSSVTKKERKAAPKRSVVRRERPKDFIENRFVLQYGPDQIGDDDDSANMLSHKSPCRDLRYEPCYMPRFFGRDIPVKGR